MRKNVVKKLRVSKETLLALTSQEAQTAVGGSDASRFSCPSGCVERGGFCPLTITTGTTN